MIGNRTGARAVWPAVPGFRREEIEVRTHAGVEFLDVTGAVAEVLARSGVAEGLVSVQSMHTTAGIVVNENERLLLHDLEAALEHVAPRGRSYRHDDMAAREEVPPDEPANGHAHCKAIFLRASETVAVTEGSLCLGRWQRILLAEMDGPRTRTVAVTVLGS